MLMRRRPGELVPLEVEILEAATALQRDGVTAFHGYSLAKAMRSDDERRTLTAHGTLYRALHRLAGANLLEAFWEDVSASEQEGRPRRRLYRLTALAHVALSRARAKDVARGESPPLTGGLEIP